MPEPGAGPARPTRVRYAVLAALAGLTIGAYLTRGSLAPAASTVGRELGLDDVTLGYALGAFAVGYTWFQLPGGWFGNRIGSRRSLALFAAGWSLCTVGTGLAAGYEALWWTRLGCGLAQAGLFPMVIAAVAAWMPPSRRGMASAVQTAAMSVGGVLASGLTAALLGPIGWRAAVQIYGWIGVAGALAFFAWYRDTPDQHPAVDDAERALIREGRDPEPPADLSDARALGRMLLAPSMQALCVQAFFRAFGYYFFMTWFPSYLERSYQVRGDLAGALNMAPLAGVVAGSLVGGDAVDRILRRTGSRWMSRSGVAAASLTLTALATLAAAAARNPWEAVALITLGTFFSGIASPATWAATIDISGRHTAIGFSLMNMSGNLGAIACPIAVGYLFDAIARRGGGFAPVMFLFAGIYFAGALAWLVLDPNRPAVGPRKPEPPRSASP